MEFLFVLIICPLVVVLASITGSFLFTQWFIVPILTFIVFTILTYTVFNETFFFWAVIFTVLSIIVSLLTYRKKK
ncbi:DUF2651 family protein [Lysinibacillus odysseyi]|uniref:DUF2651 domain-containing protein n=1 Tax=Lysinibacillus odysseyi 34hs-1 = NBRC 100172 TaxID=1220589 RepID=A0A0A3IJM7_9BACI|nr:DUF2651 family protein [Lysinibacillus odysseyi]KGR84944.1 hypothetical protein CD32_10820 [Lysinibacillus odysseyi 34hs-1 = NBRC 100172]